MGGGQERPARTKELTKDRESVNARTRDGWTTPPARKGGGAREAVPEYMRKKMIWHEGNSGRRKGQERKTRRNGDDEVRLHLTEI